MHLLQMLHLALYTRLRWCTGSCRGSPDPAMADPATAYNRTLSQEELESRLSNLLRPEHEGSNLLSEVQLLLPGGKLTLAPMYDLWQLAGTLLCKQTPGGGSQAAALRRAGFTICCSCVQQVSRAHIVCVFVVALCLATHVHSCNLLAHTGIGALMSGSGERCSF
jgi:hypothetical protein